VASNLCWGCARDEGYLTALSPDTVLASQYQLDKFVKHTQPLFRVSGWNSIFDSPSTASYATYLVTSVVSGSVTLDPRGQPSSFVWYAGGTIGATYIDGVYGFPNDAVKL
jgi:hypothetical protein